MKRLTNTKDLQLQANLIRQDLIRMLHEAGSGHTAGPLGLADLFTTLYFNLLKHNPKLPSWELRDRLILSPGHVCPIRYVTMAHTGYFPKTELLTLRKLGTRLQGHPSRKDLPGLEFSTASLGQGLGAAVGMALAAKLKKQKHYIYCITSDGEHDEGSTWEAVNAAHKYKLNNLINIIDRNNIQISGFTHNVWPLESLKEKYESYGWKVFEINGHEFKQIISVINQAKKSKDNPVCIISYNIPGKGVSFMEHDYHWHGKTPNDEETKKALKELQAEEQRLRK
ncbi:MAG: transketolase [Candidatus Woesearchaeota archaeon]|jgi:transketolase